MGHQYQEIKDVTGRGISIWRSVVEVERGVGWDVDKAKAGRDILQISSCIWNKEGGGLGTQGQFNFEDVKNNIFESRWKC